jgi:DNA-binding MarR family transcriptional regulator
MDQDVRLSRQELLQHLIGAVRAQQRANDVFDQALVEHLGINRTDGRCIDLLEQYGPMAAGELARASGLTTGAITTLLDRLERVGYVRRLPDPNDRRKVMVEITEKTRDEIHRVFGPLAEEGWQRLEQFSDGELAAIVAFAEHDRELHERHAARLTAGPRAER